MTTFTTVIGLEIHTQLKTRSKLFCACPTGAGAEPNSQICPVCSGQPGALPHTNQKAIELATKAGLALGCQISPVSIFSRKNYFYPDLPAGFQTSQLDPPICLGGGLEIELANGTKKNIRLNRIHLEDDAGKCLHGRSGESYIDLNRAGTPLIEIVTEPDFRSAEEVTQFLKKLHSIVVFLDISEGRMEEGEFRCDVNISLMPEGADQFGTRCEVKNLNSFRHAALAIDYEERRQRDLLESGQLVLQQTRLFDPDAMETRSLRSKEEAMDYRYFPQPDLPPVTVSAELLAKIKAEMPMLPQEAMARFEALGLTVEQSQLLIDRRGAAVYFDAALKEFNDPKRLATLMAELFLPACQKAEILPAEAKMTAENLAALAKLMADDTLNRRTAYELFPELFTEGENPKKLAEAKGLMQISDATALKSMAQEILAKHQKEVDEFKAGKEKVMGFFVGQMMKASKGRANPQIISEVLKELLGVAQ